MKHHRLGLCTLAIAGALLASTAALAGLRTSMQVVIVDDRSYVIGDLSATSNTSDTTQSLGCYNEPGLGICYATDSSGRSRGCSTSDPEILAAMRSLSGDSSLVFYWDTSGNCQYVYVENSSKPVLKK